VASKTPYSGFAGSMFGPELPDLETVIAEVWSLRNSRSHKEAVRTSREAIKGPGEVLKGPRVVVRGPKRAL